ncbi:MAG: hypothetical protein GAK28_04371 [Luteibacter sp.]|jgi:hypothetical protein|uniref:hypothetical protein n=1 Tax=Luteibacter sp. TaxID=1886636 RepID=UPI00137E3F06|nr:hypothetical protein [Luteibacter sp.]KAF1003908.1 MAG: hypothetical protein GAK28_04371 [Luteibacter sp.]
MQLELYKALVAANIPDEVATKLVDAMNTHIDNRVNAAVKPLFERMESMQTSLSAKLDGATAGLGTKIDAIAQLRRESQADGELRRSRVRWVVGTALTAIGIAVPATIAVLKAMNII